MRKHVISSFKAEHYIHFLDYIHCVAIFDNQTAVVFCADYSMMVILQFSDLFIIIVNIIITTITIITLIIIL